jgi:exodeoxyribonuclease V beta subunit
LPGATLRDIARRDRVDELHFELPLAGGDAPDGQVSTADIAAVLSAHMAPGGPLVGYPDRLLDPLLATTLRGYLTGSLDLVFRRTSGDGVPRWYVADYKTNWLGEDGRPLTAWHYRPSALDAEMQRHHYPLQALLYLVALHRYLRWRLPGYSPEVNLGGVLYLFLRGMVGPDTPVVDGHPCGVFSWAPPAGLIVGLSDLFVNGRS